MTRRQFGELELAIMQLLKTHGKMTVREVLEKLQSDDKYTTVMTVMNRLVEKKELQRKRIGLQYEYWLADTSSSSSLSVLERLKQKIFGGKSVAMIHYLIESSEDLTEDELKHMEQLLEQARKAKKK